MFGIGSTAAVERVEGVSLLTDAELISRIDALERTKAACAAEQAQLTARFVDRQAASAARLREVARACSDAGDFDGWVAARDEARSLELEPDERDEPGRSGRSSSRSRSVRRSALSRTGVSAQVGLARRESPSRGARLATVSVALVRHLPHTLAALGAGVLNERRAELVARGTSHLDPDLRSVVDAEVVGANLDLDDPTGPGVGSWGDRELERRVRACADRLDAAAAVERARLAESERRVTIRPAADTMAVITALLPVAQAVAVHAALTQAARSAKAAGDERGKGQLMADTLVERVTGQAEAPDVPVEAQVVITDRALLAGDDTPAHVPGYGPVPAGWARELLTRGLEDLDDPEDPGHDNEALSGAPPSHPRTDRPPGGRQPERPAARVWLRRLFTHPTSGTLVAMESVRRLFPPGLRRFVVARDGTCRTPWCDAPIAQADHVRAHADGGPTTAANGQGLCVRCNLVKEEPGWSADVLAEGSGASPHRVRLTTPTGHTHESVAPPLLPSRPVVPEAPARGQPTVDGPDEDATPTAVVIAIEIYRPAVDLEWTA
ncbi:MAG: DUF222 domain-containing protein [Terracoccus sp.]